MYDVQALADYTKENKSLIIKDVIFGELGGDVIPNLRKQLDIKTKEKLHYLSTDAVLQDGNGCGFNPSGSSVFSDREIETSQIKVDMQYCADDLLSKWTEYQVRMSATADKFPFEEEIMKDIVKSINEKMEKMIWTGDKSNNDFIDGFLTIALGADSASTVNVPIPAGSSVYNAVKSVISGAPAKLLNNGVIFVSPELYNALVFELVDKNLYHFAPDANVEDFDIKFPATNVRVHKTFGLAGDKKHLYMSVYDNMAYGTDAMNDREEARVWRDNNGESTNIKIKFNAGVQTYFPDMVVLGTAANDLI